MISLFSQSASDTGGSTETYTGSNRGSSPSDESGNESDSQSITDEMNASAHDAVTASMIHNRPGGNQEQGIQHDQMIRDGDPAYEGGSSGSDDEVNQRPVTRLRVSNQDPSVTSQEQQVSENFQNGIESVQSGKTSIEEGDQGPIDDGEFNDADISHQMTLDDVGITSELMGELACLTLSTYDEPVRLSELPEAQELQKAQKIWSDIRFPNDFESISFSADDARTFISWAMDVDFFNLNQDEYDHLPTKFLKLVLKSLEQLEADQLRDYRQDQAFKVFIQRLAEADKATNLSVKKPDSQGGNAQQGGGGGGEVTVQSKALEGLNADKATNFSNENFSGDMSRILEILDVQIRDVQIRDVEITDSLDDDSVDDDFGDDNSPYVNKKLANALGINDDEAGIYNQYREFSKRNTELLKHYENIKQTQSREAIEAQVQTAGLNNEDLTPEAKNLMGVFRRPLTEVLTSMIEGSPDKDLDEFKFLNLINAVKNIIETNETYMGMLEDKRIETVVISILRRVVQGLTCTSRPKKNKLLDKLLQPPQTLPGPLERPTFKGRYITSISARERKSKGHLVDMPPLTGVVLSYGSTANVLKAALLDKIDRSQLGYRDTQPSLGDAPYIPGTQRSASPIPRPPKRKKTSAQIKRPATPQVSRKRPATPQVTQKGEKKPVTSPTRSSPNSESKSSSRIRSRKGPIKAFSIPGLTGPGTNNPRRRPMKSGGRKMVTRARHGFDETKSTNMQTAINNFLNNSDKNFNKPETIREFQQMVIRSIFPNDNAADINMNILKSYYKHILPTVNFPARLTEAQKNDIKALFKS